MLQRDLNAVRATLRLRYPTCAMVCDLEESLQRMSGIVAAYNPGVTAFYRDGFLEGPEIDVANNNALGHLAQNCMVSYFPFTCSTSWDNQISSAKTGSDGAYLYNYPYMNTSGGYVYIPATDSVEVWRYFNDVASSVFVP